MNTTTWIRITAVGGIVGGVAWCAKVAVIAVTGTSGGIDVPLFAVGALTLLLGASGIGVALTRSRAVAVRIAAGIGAALLGGVAFLVATNAAEVLRPLAPAHLGSEFSIVLAALLGLGLGVRALRRGPVPA